MITHAVLSSKRLQRQFILLSPFNSLKAFAFGTIVCGFSDLVIVFMDDSESAFIKNNMMRS